MEEYSEKELKEKYKSLPPRLKEALFNPEISEKVSKIGEKFGLSGWRIEELAKISGRVFLGDLPLKELAGRLRELNLDKEKAQKLTENLELEVFSDYKEEIEEVSKPKEPELPKAPEEIVYREEEKVMPVPEKARKELGIPPGGYESPVARAKKKKLEQLEKSEEIKKREELLTKKEPDKYREPLEGEEKIKVPRVVKQEGKIKKIF